VEVTEELREQLAGVIAFRYLSGEELEHLVGAAQVVDLDADQTIISEGQVNQDLFVVLSGAVNVTTVGDAEKQVFISAIGEGEVFGEAGIFLTVRRTANVVSAQKTRLLRIDRAGLMSFFRRYPSAGIKMLMILVYGLLKKLRTSNQELAFERKADMQQDDIDALVNSLMKDG
jgi:CRP-like cAMP-binding protein